MPFALPATASSRDTPAYFLDVNRQHEPTGTGEQAMRSLRPSLLKIDFDLRLYQGKAKAAESSRELGTRSLPELQQVRGSVDAVAVTLDSAWCLGKRNQSILDKPFFFFGIATYPSLHIYR